MQRFVKGAGARGATAVMAVVKFAFYTFAWFVGSCLICMAGGTGITWGVSSTPPQFFAGETWALIAVVSVSISGVITGIATVIYGMRVVWNAMGRWDQRVDSAKKARVTQRPVRASAHAHSRLYTSLDAQHHSGKSNN